MGQRTSRITVRAARAMAWATAAVVGLGAAAGAAVPAYADAGDEPTTSSAKALTGARVPALLADGLAEATDSRYVYDPASKNVRVEMSTTIRNLKPDQGNAYFYWTNYAVPVPHNAKDLRAVSNGATLPIDLQDSEDKYVKWAMASFSQLNYGQSRTIEWSFVIPGDPIRSEGYTRMGKGYATFEVYASGDAGSTNVEVVAPKGMEFTSSNGRFTRDAQGDRATWSSDVQTQDYGIWALVSLRDRDAADSTKVTVDGVELTLLSFPGDEKWTTFVKSRLKEGLPVVEEMIGQEWPGGLQEIREDVSTEVVGYAWFDPSNEEIIIGEDLDEQLFFHELTHTWVNGDTLGDRWLSEGLTEVIARRVVKNLGGGIEREKVGRHDAGSLPLTEWEELTGSFSEADSETEAYAYAAAAATVEKLVADLDDKEFTELVSALLENRSPYQRSGDWTEWDEPDWRRMLDLLEDEVGAKGAQKTLKTWVLTDKQKRELPERAKAREKYFAIDKADGSWDPPEGLRARMTMWEFTKAREQRSKIGDAPGFALRVQDAAAAGGFDDPAAVREAYEQAVTTRDYDNLRELMRPAARTTEQVSAVVQKIDADGDPFTELGEWLLAAENLSDSAVRELDGGDLRAATANADRANLLHGLAPWAGGASTLFVIGLAVGLFFLARMLRRRSATRRPGSPPGGPYAGQIGPYSVPQPPAVPQTM